MRTEKLQLSDIRYNPEEEAYEALVKVHDSGHVFAYPAQLRAPMHAEFGVIANGLAAKASKAHRSPDNGLRLRQVQLGAIRRAQRSPKLQDMPFMQLVLKAMAA